MNVLQNQSLLTYNTFGVNASTQYWINVTTIDELKEGLTFSRDKKLLIIGGGSNLLLLNNWEGVTLRVDLKGIEHLEDTETHYYVKALAGENWHDFVSYCISNNWGGLENLSLIPGNVGASPMQNIGAYGVEIKDVFYELEALNRATFEIEKFTLEQCQFDYRSSIFKTSAKDKYIILNVTYKLAKNHCVNTNYGAIEDQLKALGINNPSIKEVSDAVIAIRTSKLPNPKELGNAGSFFKNPVIPQDQFLQIKLNHPDISAYPQDDGMVKVAAGWLIEMAGWKGKRTGNCGVHAKQALVLVNYGDAKGQDIYNLSEDILHDVKTKFGIELEREVNMIK